VLATLASLHRAPSFTEVQHQLSLPLLFVTRSVLL
jgi:hypothetical protein